MDDKTVLISGAGIAGPTLAYWLQEWGWRPTLVERSPQARAGGYVIDFWGAGFDIAERMGLVPGLRREGYDVQELRIAGAFAPKTRFGLFLRNQISRLFAVPFIADPVMGASLTDRLDLPRYGRQRRPVPQDAS